MQIQCIQKSEGGPAPLTGNVTRMIHAMRGRHGLGREQSGANPMFKGETLRIRGRNPVQLKRTPMRIEETKADDRLWFYVPPEMHQKIKAAAKADDRSVANWLRRIVGQQLRSERAA
jgi:hypothetical protein